MKLIRFKDAITIDRPDGRTIFELVTQDVSIKAENVKFIYVTHPAGFTEKIHFHKRSYEAFYFMDEARYKINDVNYDIMKGDMVIFEPGDVHGGLPTPHEVRLFIMQFPSVKGDKYFPEESE